MNKIFLSSIAFGLLALAGCSRMAPEVVEYDPSYKPKEPTKLDRDKVDVPPVDLLTKYVLFVNNNQLIYASVLSYSDGTVEVQDIADAEVVVRLSSPMDKDITVKVTEMTEQNQPATYKTVLAGENKLLPADMYELSTRELKFTAGEVEQRITVTFDKEKIKELDKIHSFVIPLVVELPNEPNLKDDNFCLLSVKVSEVELVPEGQNITYGGSVAGLNLMPVNVITPQTTYAADRVGVIIDAKKTENWWVPSNSSETLTLSFPKQLVKAVMIYCAHSKNISSVDVSVSNSGGKMFSSQGTVINPFASYFWADDMPVIFVFDKPYEIDAIKFSNFVGNQDFIDITEIEILY